MNFEIGGSDVSGETIVFGDLVRRPVPARFAASTAVLTSACADAGEGSIPCDKPLAAPDEPDFRTLADNCRIAPMDALTMKGSKADHSSGAYSVDLTAIRSGEADHPKICPGDIVVVD